MSRPAGRSSTGGGLLEAEVVFACRASGPAAPSALSPGLSPGTSFLLSPQGPRQEMGRGVLRRPRNWGEGSVKTRNQEAEGVARILAGSAPGPSEAFSRPPGGWTARPVRGLCPLGGPLTTTQRWHLRLQCRPLRPRTQEPQQELGEGPEPPASSGLASDKPKVLPPKDFCLGLSSASPKGSKGVPLDAVRQAPIRQSPP